MDPAPNIHTAGGPVSPRRPALASLPDSGATGASSEPDAGVSVATSAIAPANLAGEVVGWGHPQRARMTRVGARGALAAALGVSPAEIETLSPSTVSRALARLRDIAEERSRLALAAERDELTGATRRGPGLEMLVREVSRAHRLGQPLSVAFLDVDGLKMVNDEEGHPAGDRLLCAVVSALRERLRAYDLVARYGGDEFVVALPGTSRATAQWLLAGIDAQLRQRTGGRGVSVGIAELAGGETATDVVARADQLLVGQRRRLRKSEPR